MLQSLPVIKSVKTFRRLRMSFGLTQKQVAVALRTSRGHVANLESGRDNASPAYIEKLNILAQGVYAFADNLGLVR